MATLLLTLTACHSNYVSLEQTTNFDPRPAFLHDDTSQIAFVSTQRAYQQATGIAAFPDGGQSKDIYNKTGLFLYNGENKKLIHIMAIPNIPYLYMDAKIVQANGFIYYNCELDRSKSITPERALALKDKYSKCLAINTTTNDIHTIDTTEFNTLYQKYYSECSLTELNNHLKKIPLAMFGLLIHDIYPKSDKKYIEETIYLKNGSKTSRRAVVEQIIAPLPKHKIKDLLRKMDEHKNSLEGLKKKEYEIYSQDTYKNIQALL